MHELACVPPDPAVMWSLPLVIFGFWAALWIESWRSRSSFRLVHIVTDMHGRGSKEAVAYMIIVIVGAWAVWALLLRCELSEWLWTSYLAAFVLGAVAGTAGSVLARVKGMQEPPPDAGDKPKHEGDQHAA